MPDQKDQNVLSFMTMLVQQKFGDDVDYEFLEQESNKLYDTFGDKLVSYFEPMLSEEQKSQFDEMIERKAEQDEILGFLMSAIPQLDVKIQQVLISFRNDYLNAPVE